MIELRNCNKIYANKKTGIKNVNLSFNNNGFILIQGESGSGKSTLINCMYGLDYFSSGEILLDGKPIKCLQDYSTFIFQEPKFFENMTVLENILFSLKDKSIDIDNILLKLKIKDKMNQPINLLSGGERQRVSLARALMKDTPIIFCDEPTSNLDIKTELEIFDLLKEISNNKLVVIVSHNSRDIANYADQKIIINAGLVIENLIISKSDSIELLPVKKVKFLNRFAFIMSLNNIRFNIVKSIMTILFMFFSLFIISFLLNILTININTFSYNAYLTDEVDYVQFNRINNDDINNFGSIRYSITDSTLEEINPEIISYDYVNLKTIYDSNVIFFHNVWVNLNDDLDEYILGQNEVYVSSNLFTDNYSDVNELIGEKLQISNNLLIIKGFLPSDYNDIIMMNNYTFNLCNNNLLYDSYFSLKLTDQSYSHYSAYNPYTSSVVPNIIEGNSPSTTYEICLPKNLLEQLFPNEEIINLIGQEISLVFLETSIYRSMENISYNETFTLSGYTNSNIIFYDNDYSKYATNYGSERISSGALGAIYLNYSLTTFVDASEHQLFHQGILSEKIYNIYNFLNSFKMIILIILVIFIVIEIFTIINNVATSILKNKKELGILISFGIEKIALCKIYIFETLFCAIISVLFAVIAYIISVNILNTNFAKEYLIDFNVLNINIIIILLLFLISLLILSISVIFPMLKIIRKKQIDILYER